MRVSLEKILQKAVWAFRFEKKADTVSFHQSAESWPVPSHMLQVPIQMIHKGSVLSSKQHEVSVCPVCASSKMAKYLIVNLPQLRSWIFFLVFWQRKFVLHNLLSKEAKKYSSLHFPGGSVVACVLTAGLENLAKNPTTVERFWKNSLWGPRRSPGNGSAGLRVLFPLPKIVIWKSTSSKVSSNSIEVWTVYLFPD